MSRHDDRKPVAGPVTHWRVLALALVVGWSSAVAATPLVMTSLPPTGGDATPPATVAADLAPTAAPSHPLTGWVAGGFGTAGIAGQDGDVVRVEIALAAGMHLFSLRYVFAIQTSDGCGVFVCSGSASLPANSANEVALQYGIKKRIPYLLLTASAGVSALWTVQQGSTMLPGGCLGGCVYNSIDGRTIGATAELGGYLTSRYLSVGPTLVVDVNSIQSFWGLLFDLHFGWMGDGGLFRGRQSP
jgi:hypothetical protein